MDTEKLSGHVALITGGGGEIGRAIAERFAREGAKVVVADLSLDLAESAAATIHAMGGTALALEMDVANADSAANAVKRTGTEYGALTLLVNVAAAPTIQGTVETIDLADWDLTFAVNVTGTFLACKYAVPEMRKAGGGVIINMASQLGHIGRPAGAPYCTSKAALIFFTKILAIDHARDNIRVNSISPGAISTVRSSLSFGGDKDKAALVHGPKHLLGRPGRVEEVAAAASYLASDDASFVTGTDLLVDGGYIAFKGTVDADRQPNM
jgi:NAD(P)-dependent dehydrogenase (short-subunit alcohol dehydrogenase family)